MEICKRCKYAPTCSASSESDFCLNYEPRPLTNADRIRAMSNEELAEWMEWHDYCPDPLPHAPCIGPDGEPRAEYDCYQCCLDWLKQEAYNG